MHTITIDTDMNTTGENLWQIYTELGHLNLAVMLDNRISPTMMQEYLLDIKVLRGEVRDTYYQYYNMVTAGATDLEADLAVGAGEIVDIVNLFGIDHTLHGKPLCKVVYERDHCGEA